MISLQDAQTLLQPTDGHIAEWIDVDEKPIGLNGCAIPDPEGEGSICWVQDGLANGLTGNGSHHIGSIQPEIYWETSNMWGYDIEGYRAFAPPISLFFSDFATGGTDGYGHPMWASYVSELGDNWAPFNIGNSPMYWNSMPMNAETEVEVAAEMECPITGLVSFGSTNLLPGAQPDPANGLKNATYPANNYTLWTSSVGSGAAFPYFYVNYKPNWFFQTSGGQP